MTTITASTTLGIDLNPAFYTSPVVIGAGVIVSNTGYPYAVYRHSGATTFFAIENTEPWHHRGYRLRRLLGTRRFGHQRGVRVHHRRHRRANPRRRRDCGQRRQHRGQGRRHRRRSAFWRFGHQRSVRVNHRRHRRAESTAAPGLWSTTAASRAALGVDLGSGGSVTNAATASIIAVPAPAW